MNPDRFSAFLARLRQDVYPEPPTRAHEVITARAIGRIIEVADPLPAPGSAILDLGCGQGTAIREWRRRGYRCEGLTAGQEDAEACRAAGLPVDVGDMHDMPYEAERFGMVWARHVLEHSPIPLYALAEINRVLVPGGLLYVEVPMPGAPLRHEWNPNHYSVLGDEMWASLLTRAGFVEGAPDDKHIMRWSLSIPESTETEVWLGMLGRKERIFGDYASSATVTREAA